MNLLHKQNEKTVKLVVYGASILVSIVVVALNQKLIAPPKDFPSFIYKLPALNAFINGTCSVLLIASLIAIKTKNITLHKNLNLTAFILSALFLISYVTAHFFIPDTKYGDINHDGVMSMQEKELVSGIKPVYLIILLTHILLAVIILPLILMSFYYGLTDQRTKHKKLTRWSYPIWLYVTISGVIVYLMINKYYGY